MNLRATDNDENQATLVDLAWFLVKTMIISALALAGLAGWFL